MTVEGPIRDMNDILEIEKIPVSQRLEVESTLRPWKRGQPLTPRPRHCIFFKPERIITPL